MAIRQPLGGFSSHRGAHPGITLLPERGLQLIAALNRD